MVYMWHALESAGLVEALVECVRDKAVPVQRRAMASLGELLFYIASQQVRVPCCC